MDTCIIYVVQALSHVEDSQTVAHQASLSLSFPSLSYLLEFLQTHVQWVIDAIQPFYPLSLPSPPAFNISQHQGLFQWVSSLHQVAKYIGPSASASVLPVNVQGWFPLVFDRCHLLAVQGTLESFPAPQFARINSQALSLLYGPNLISIHDY